MLCQLSTFNSFGNSGRIQFVSSVNGPQNPGTLSATPTGTVKAGGGTGLPSHRLCVASIHNNDRSASKPWKRSALCSCQRGKGDDSTMLCACAKGEKKKTKSQEGQKCTVETRTRVTKVSIGAFRLHVIRGRKTEFSFDSGELSVIFNTERLLNFHCSSFELAVNSDWPYSD